MQTSPNPGAADPARPRPTTPRLGEPSIDKAAADWQIILHLRALVERNPECVTDLLEGLDTRSPDYAALIYAAVREAVAVIPDRADIHYYCAWAAIFAQHRADAVPLLDRCLELSPQHREARLLLGRIHTGAQ